MVHNQPPYQIHDLKLSDLWIDLVRHDKVAATVQLPNENDEAVTTTVKYGVRMVSSEMGPTCQEFVMQDGCVSDETNQHPSIRSINETLSKLQGRQQDYDDSPSTSGVAFREAGGFVAQLQLVRTLRPPPSPGFSGTITSVPPPYNESTDSFVTGPLRLQLRPLVGRLTLDEENPWDENDRPLHTPWDVYHNVSPADVRGHFLLLPTISKTSNWRGQVFTEEDCHDMVHLTNAIMPPGSLLIGYNSVGAGASQNHIHCHVWPCPPVPLLKHDDTAGWNAYPVSKVTSIYDFFDVFAGDTDQVEVSYLKYPVFCVLLSASSQSLNLLGKVLTTVMECLDAAPHNLAFLNRFSEDNDERDLIQKELWVDVYVFARSKERSDVLPTLKLGVSEMMGVFHAQSNEELQCLSTLIPREQFEDDGHHSLEHDHDHDHDEVIEETMSIMEHALADVSIDDEAALWQSIKSKLEELSTL
ncbi:hypothetical protein IV203_001237 [Nitzschia inconspicua]|uniref:Uncharacterized protein n=1 Tax=Nitzschia inconspicua TaxID=303405 RepID=A0A9K3L909_9STRA|nr:hypothetical protein IV203_001237 [Nitzschia inconspicua]